MATQTPRRPEEEIHGEPMPRPRFGPDSDDNMPARNPTDPRGNDVAAGNASDPRGDKVASPESLSAAEQAAGKTSEKAASSELSALGNALGKGFNPMDSFKGGRLGRMFGLLARNKKKAVGGAIGGGVVGGGIFLASILQGPLQFIHFSQLMQQFHFSQHDEFIEGRSDRILLYSLAGLGGERGRLGVASNKAANIWASQVERKTGLRPLYLESTFRHAGWLIVDEQKARTYVEKARQQGHEIRRAGAEAGGQRLVGPRGDTSIREGNRQAIVYKAGRGFSDARAFINDVSKNTGQFGISQMGARLLKKRGGVTYHVLEKFGYRQFLDNRANARSDKERKREYELTVKSRFAKKIKRGFKSVSGFRVQGQGKDADEDGKDDADPNAVEAGEEASEVLEEYEQGKSGPGEELQKDLRSRIVRSGLSATAVVGILCATKSVGDQQEEYKHVNNVLPMMRLGTAFTSIGSQVQSGDEVDPDELGVFNDYFYDEKAKTSWTQANTVLQEEGKAPLGKKYDLPPEAQLDNVGSKSSVFKILDSFGPLGFACDVEDAIFGLPIIKQASAAVGFVTDEAINAALSPFGTSKEELLESALAIISGDTVNPYAEGAEFGNLANTGAFLASNDEAIASGGRALTNQEVAALKDHQRNMEKEDYVNKSFAQRYLDIYDTSSVLGNFSMQIGYFNAGSMLASLNPLPLINKLVFPSTNAASAESIYGAPKYGFSLEERSMFENPFKNAKWIETGDRLEKLNSKYGKCFNMEVVPDGDSIRLENGDDVVNTLKMEKEKNGDYKDCFSKSMNLLRYRFYLADAITAKSLACYYDDEDTSACDELGAEAADTSSGATGTTSAAGANIDTESLTKPSISIACAPNTKDAGIIDGYTGGKKVKIRLCEVTNLPQTSGYGSKNGHATVNSRVSGAVYAMVDAAQKDGVNMSASSSSRTMQDQQSLCPCDGVSVAIPGYSNHQLGIAIDFGGNGILMDTSNPMWKWLDKNAHKFDYKPYEVEPWHWSPLGS